MDVTVPETLAGNLGGGIPAPTTSSLYSNSYKDLSALLANPNSNLASDINSAASGALTGLVFNGKPADLINNVVRASLQVEASRQLEAEQNAHQREAQEKASKDSNEMLAQAAHENSVNGTNPNSTGLTDLISGGVSPTESALPGSASGTKEESSPLKGTAELAAIGASIGQFNKADIENVSTASLGTGTPATNSPAVATSLGTILAI